MDNGDLVGAEQKLRWKLDAWAAKYDMPIMMTDGADTAEGLHSVWDIPWTEEYQTVYVEMNHRGFGSLPAFVGEQIWSFADFRTSVGIHRVDGDKEGVFTRDRQPKASAHYLRRRWSGLSGRKP